jgi:hypothetical protein
MTVNTVIVDYVGYVDHVAATAPQTPLVVLSYQREVAELNR